MQADFDRKKAKVMDLMEIRSKIDLLEGPLDNTFSTMDERSLDAVFDEVVGTVAALKPLIENFGKPE